MEQRSSRVGLCLCGGGVTGAMYQVGCLAALEDRIESFSTAGFDVYVGTSSGAAVATALAGGLPVQRLYRALEVPAVIVAGIVSIAPADPAAASARLKRAGVQHSLREGAIRLSPHCYNTCEEVERALAVMAGEAE